MEIDPPLAREARVSPVNDVVLIPPREIIPPTTLGDLPFGFVPLIDIPCVMAREKELGAGDMFTTDPEGSMVLCDFSPVTILAPDSGSIPQDISALEPKAEAPYQLLNSIGEQTEEVKKEDGKSNQKSNTNVSNQIPKTPNIDGQFIAEFLPCPPLDTLAKTPIGSLGKGGLARIKGWQRDILTGKCETVWQGLNPLEIAGNYSPPAPLLVSTSAIAVTSILAVGTLQPYIKIVQKQIQKQVKKRSKALAKKLFKKKEEILSVSQRRKAQRDLRK